MVLMSSHLKRPYCQKRRIPQTGFYLTTKIIYFEVGHQKRAMTFNPSSKSLPLPNISLKWIWWLVFVSGVNKVPWLSDTCGYVYTLQLLFVYCPLSMVWNEWRKSMYRGRWSVLWYPNSSILRILFHCFIIQQHHPMSKTMLNALSVFSHFRLVNILYQSSCVSGYRISHRAQ